MDYVEKAARVLDLEISERQRLRHRLGPELGRAVDRVRQAVGARGKTTVLGRGHTSTTGWPRPPPLPTTDSPQRRATKPYPGPGTQGAVAATAFLIVSAAAANFFSTVIERASSRPFCAMRWARSSCSRQ